MGELCPLARHGVQHRSCALRDHLTVCFLGQHLSPNNMRGREPGLFCPRIEFWRGTGDKCGAWGFRHGASPMRNNEIVHIDKNEDPLSGSCDYGLLNISEMELVSATSVGAKDGDPA